ncbi:MAG: type II toxin-antitoxin system PrlF family antitoxin [Gemmatimonadetes bacterium]|nr:type II toxin-antitoxin system PrlF family antitoxin [Gemmatimonadota bacterium]
MPSSSVTAKGQTTIPRQIRDYPKLQPGNRIDYVVDESGNVCSGVPPTTSGISMGSFINLGRGRSRSRT